MKGEGTADESDLKEAARALDVALDALRRARGTGHVDIQAARKALEAAERQLRLAKEKMASAERRAREGGRA